MVYACNKRGFMYHLGDAVSTTSTHAKEVTRNFLDPVTALTCTADMRRSFDAMAALSVSSHYLDGLNECNQSEAYTDVDQAEQ